MKTLIEKLNRPERISEAAEDAVTIIAWLADTMELASFVKKFKLSEMKNLTSLLNGFATEDESGEWLIENLDINDPNEQEAMRKAYPVLRGLVVAGTKIIGEALMKDPMIMIRASAIRAGFEHIEDAGKDERVQLKVEDYNRIIEELEELRKYKEQHKDDDEK